MPHIFTATFTLNGYVMTVSNDVGDTFQYKLDKAGHNAGPIASGGQLATYNLAKNAGFAEIESLTTGMGVLIGILKD